MPRVVLNLIVFLLLALLPATATERHSSTTDKTEKGVISIRIEHGDVKGVSKQIRIRQGDTVHLRWTTDEATTIHLHGYDLEKHMTPGKPTEMKFTARAAGRFPVTIHHSGDHGHEHERGGSHGREGGEKTLLYIEVHPR